MAFNIIYKSNDEEEEKKRKKLIEEGANQQLERNRQANEQFNRNYEERNNFFNNVGRVADSFLTGLGTTAANVGTGVLSVINDNPVNLATRSARDNLIGKIENTDLAGYAEKLKAIKNPTEQRIDWLSDIKRQNEAKIQNLQSQTDSEFAKNVIGFVPNLSQQAVNIGASLVNPGLGMAVATAGAKGSYLDVAKQRGMNEEESRTFSNIMAVVEGATEMIGINNITKGIKGVNALAKTGIKGAKKEIQKEIVDTAIKSYGKSILDNAVQEAITEPIQEAVADITAKKGDWQNILGRSLESGFSGALTAAITGGVSMGISAAVGYVQKVSNGYKPTQAETIQAVNQIYNEATENQKQVLNYAIKDGVEIATQQSILPTEENGLKSNVETNNTILDSDNNNNIDIQEQTNKKTDNKYAEVNSAENNQNTEQQLLLNRAKTTPVEQTQIERAEPTIQQTEPVVTEEKGERKTFKSVAENVNQPQEIRDIAQSLRETNLYQKKKNSQVLAQSQDKIKKIGADNLLNDITDRVNNNARLSTEDTGTLIELLDYYGKKGDTQKAETTLQNLAMSGTETAQALQIMRALNHQTPQGQAIWIQRSADKLNKSILAKKKATIETINGEQRIIDKNGKDITSKTPLFNFTQEMQQKLLNANSDNMYDVIDEIYTEMGQQVPKSKIEQFDEWRYFSMLGNPKTHIRNMLGNITMEGLRQAKNKLAGAIEDAYYSVTGKEGERTHTLRFADKKTKDFAKQDVKNRDVQTMLGVTEDKYNPQSRLKQSQRTFKSEALEKTIGRLEKANTNLLSKEDVSVLGIAGLEPAYQRSLTEYITANNLDVDTMTSKQLAKAREYAVAEAKEATFHTYNKIASMINTLENKNLATKILVGGTVPFKQTPMNVAIQGFEYSPAGLLKTLTYNTVQLKNGNINANQYINKISKGLTGTGIALLGYALTSAGILKASGSGDDKDDYEKAQGKQTYSIKIGDNTYTLDWLAPAGIPLFIGSELYQISKADAEEKKGGNATQSEIAQSAENIFNAMTTTMNPMTEMTMLSGLTSTLKSYANDPAQTLGNILINTGKSYVTQSVPTALGQVARSTDDKERSTSSTESNVFTKAIDSTKNQIMSKVPGLRQLLPVATDVWGNEAKSKNYIENAILPANRKEIKEEPLDKELTRLYDATGESSVIPDTYIDKTLTIAKEKYRLSNEEYADLKKQYGQTSYKILSNLTSSSDYKNMTDEQKVKAVTEAYKYAKASLKVTYADWNNLDADANSTYKKVQNVIDKGGDAKDYFTYVGLTDGLKTETEKNRALRDSDLGSKSAIYESTTGSDDQIYPIMKKAKTNINAYLDYKLADIQGVKNEEGKTISGSKKQAFNDYLNSSKMNYNQKLLLKGVNYKLTNYEKNLLLDYLDTLKLSDNEYNDVLLKLK